MTALSTFGKLARELRIRKGVTISAQASVLGITPSAISRIETGNEKPTLEYADKFAKWVEADLIEHQELRRSAISGKQKTSDHKIDCSRLYRRKLNTLTGEEIRELGERARGKPNAR